MEEKTELQLKTTQTGGKYYEKLPPGTRIAHAEDFYNGMGKLILNKPYLVHSMINPDRYWTNRVKPGFPYPESEFKAFLDGGCVYVFEKG